MDSAEALRDQPAVEEAIAWAAVASAVEDAAVEVAEEAEADADNRPTIERAKKTAMKGTVRFLVILAVGTALPSLGQVTSSSPSGQGNSDFEELPELQASEILKPEFLKGQYHTVQESVPTSSGMNRFTIDSQFGAFEAEGNEMLVRRVGEIEAIGKLKEVSRTDVYKQALAKAAKSPYESAKNIIRDPVNSIENVPKGVMKFMKGAGEKMKGIGKKEKSSDKSEGSQVEQLIGYSNTKRKVAVSLGVDPYTTNSVLRKELDGIAWATFAGGATFSVATLPVGGAAGVGLTVAGVSSSMNQLLVEKSPEDLKAYNRQSLIAMGASGNEADRLLGNPAYTPTQQTAFVLNMKSLDGVANRKAFIRLAGMNSSSDADAIFCVQTAAMLGKLHQEIPLARIETIGDFPIAVAKDGTTVVALQWDYAAWTSGAANFTQAVQNFASEAPRNKKVVVALSGQTSERLHRELEARGIQLRDRYLPGPLK